MNRVLRAWRIARRFQEVASDRITRREPSIQPNFTCPLCGATSYHPKDVEEGYCGRCHWWTGREDLLAAKMESWFHLSVNGEVPDGCPLHPTLFKALVQLFRRD